ncbi:hypothetical protein [Microlunatus parietis]|uniref:Uncharacterized protein n=1 Tax=Microlunatus parietis TaxID=682979 RepID=A0A7Y9IEW3_9ACTN|nr:hypothetical protein [Microlunatus parietis]NYE75248.1 hypothetical protein [Microlunatus parietis]
MNEPYDAETHGRLYAESLTRIIRAGERERDRQHRDATGHRLELDGAETAAASAGRRREQLRQNADELEQFAADLLARAQLPVEGERMVLEPPVITTTAEAETAIRRIADEIAVTAEEVIREREDRTRKLRLAIVIASWIVLPGSQLLWAVLSSGSWFNGIVGAAPILLAMLAARKAGLELGQAITGLAVIAAFVLSFLIGGSFLSTLLILFLIVAGIVAVIKMPRDWVLRRRLAAQNRTNPGGTEPWNESEV